MRPRNASPTPTSGRSRTSSTWLPGATPARSPSGMSSTRPVRKPTTSAKMPPWSRVEMRQSEPTGAPGPLASTTSPITAVTRPLTRTASSSRSRRRAREKSRSAAGGSMLTASPLVDPDERPLDGLELRLDAEVHLAEAALDDAAPRRQARVLDQVELLDGVERCSQLRQRVAQEGEEPRGHADRDPLAVDDAPHGGADETEPDLRPLGQLLLDDLPRHAERQLEQLALVALAQPPAEGGELLEGLDERLGAGRELAGRLLAAEVVARLEGAAELVARFGGRRGLDRLGVGDRRAPGQQRPEAHGVRSRAGEGRELGLRQARPPRCRRG